MTAIDALLAAAVLAAAGALLAALRLYQVRAQPPPDPELVRKLFHIGGGAIGLSLPWLFDTMTPVLALAAVLTASFAALRVVARLRRGVGQVLLGVERRTAGEFCYLASMGLLFWLSDGDRLLYSVPLLVLALGDAFAALVGEAVRQAAAAHGARAQELRGRGGLHADGLFLRARAGAALRRHGAPREPARRRRA